MSRLGPLQDPEGDKTMEGNWTLLIGIISGLGLPGGSRDFQTLLHTALVVNICNVFLCRIIAKNSGKSRAGWMLAGLVFGVWAVLILIIRSRRGIKSPAESQRPAPDEAGSARADGPGPTLRPTGVVAVKLSDR